MGAFWFGRVTLGGKAAICRLSGRLWTPAPRFRWNYTAREQAPARARGVKVEHSCALQRTEELVNRLDARLAQPQRTGDVGFFNREYKRRRQQAQAAGRPFMPYKAAQARLRKALVGVAAGDRPGIVARVFGPQ